MRRVTQREHRQAIAMLHRLADKTMRAVLTAAFAPTVARLHARHAALTADASDELGFFLSAWAQLVDDELKPLLDTTFGLGSLAAARQLRKAAAVGDVSDFVSQARLRWVAGAEDRWTTLGDEVWRLAKEQLLAGITAGESTDLLAARLADVAGFAEPTALNAARSLAVASANAGGFAEVSALGMTLGPEGKQWLCVASGTRVASAKPVEIMKRRRGLGIAVTISTAAGRVLTVTPDHPVLTLDGWLAAASLLPGQQVICDSSSVKSLEDELPSRLGAGLRPNGMNPDVVNTPPVVDEVFDTAARRNPQGRVMGVVVDLHCDPIDCEVEVVPIDRELARVLQFPAIEFLSESILKLSDEGLESLLGARRSDEYLFGDGEVTAAVSASGGAIDLASRQSLSGSFAPKFGRLAQRHGIESSGALVADGDSSQDETIMERLVTDAELLGQHCERIPAFIGGDGCLQIEVDSSGFNAKPLRGAGLFSGRRVIGESESRGFRCGSQDTALLQPTSDRMGRDAHLCCQIFTPLAVEVSLDESIDVERDRGATGLAVEHPESGGLLFATNHPTVSQASRDRFAGHSDIVGQIVSRLASQVAMDEIVNVEIGSWPAGHFYDLVTEQGWFVANGIIVHNSTNDGRTRETHADVHGQIQRLDRPFEVGADLLDYPGDPNGSMEETAGCRCALIYVQAIEDVGPSDLENITMELPTEAVAAAGNERAAGCHCLMPHTCECQASEEIVASWECVTTEGLTAAAEQHTGGMVALVPTEADAQRLAVDGYEPADVLHATLAFLGDGATLPDVTKAEIHSIVSQLAAQTTPIIGNAHGVAVFNAASEEPCQVYLVGDTDLIGPNGVPPIMDVHDQLWAELDDYGSEGFPDQHSPYVAHLAISYSGDLGALDQAGSDVTFDRLRVAFGDVVHDYPLAAGDTVPVTGTGEAAMTMTDEQATAIGEKVGASLVNALGLAQNTSATGNATNATVTLAAPPTPPADMPKDDMPAEDPNAPTNDAVASEEFHILMVTEEQATLEKPSRFFAAQCFEWREPPFPLMWLATDTHSEGDPDPSVQVGLVTRVERQGLEIHGYGHWDDPINEDAAEARRRVENGMLQWNSVDIGDVGESDIELVFPPPGTVAPDGIEVMEPEQVRFHHGRLVLSTLVFAPAQENAQIEPLIFADGTTDMMPMEPMPGEPMMAAAYALTIPDVPDASWFAKPDRAALKRGCLTITDEGRIYGLLAPGAVPHVGLSERTTVPLRNVDYRDFLRGETPVRLADGSVGRVVTGNLTMACGHADRALPNGATVSHYDNSCSLFATAVCGEADGDVWVAGALLPGVDADQVRRAMACQLSGHWNPHELARGRYSLLAGLLVPIPGFPKGRSEATATTRWGPNDDGDLVMVASAVPVRFEASEPATVALSPVAERIAKSVGLDHASRSSAIRASAAQIAERVGLDRRSRAEKIAARVKGS